MAGKRRGDRRDRRARRRGAQVPGTVLPLAPTLIGATALAVAGVGAVGGLGIGGGLLPGGTPSLRLSAGSTLTGTDAFAFDRHDPRTRALSRDSERQALEEALNRRLKAEAEQQSQERDAELTKLAKSAQRRADQIEENLWVLPTEGYHITATFGQTSGLWASVHTGLDFAAPTGTPIFAVADGVITSDGYDGSYGYKTVETLQDGTEIWYCHQSEMDVQVGEHVGKGQTIGRVGSTGNTTGPHVHIEVRPGGGAPVDPYPVFVEHGVTP